jgi:NIPSNAP
MITRQLRYVLDPAKIMEFEHFGRIWISLTEKFGGKHHGYLLPSEGASNIALCSFSFSSLAAYEEFRTKAAKDPGCQAAFRYAEETRCFPGYERTFFRPLFE